MTVRQVQCLLTFLKKADGTSYYTGDVVSHGGKLYKSTIDGNVWAPDAYPAGWEPVKE